MAKTYINSTKYEISAVFKIEGVVDKHDVVGAIFGQSEGLLGEDLDLRELQKNGKIGRIEIIANVQNGITTGNLVVPSSLDIVETCIIGATIETVDKVGPCNATFKVVNIKDKRTWKREQIVSRAQELLDKAMHEQIPETEELIKTVKERLRVSSLAEYGPDKLPAGDAIESSDHVIVVEGRADVLTLLKNNIRNVIGMDGSKISPTIAELSKRKKIVAFVDGDRGGELILRKLMQLAKIDFVARAPEGKEVEELTNKEIVMALRKKVPSSEIKLAPQLAEDIPENIAAELSAITKEMNAPPALETQSPYAAVMAELRGTLKAKIFGDNLTELKTVAVRDLLKTINETKGAKVIVLDGIITKRLVDIAEEAGVTEIVGAKIGKLDAKPKKLKLTEVQ
ncbi:MAG: DNA primase DnaG [Candidatus Diapherotrites archaeon]|nr:DNA primase DnaG [Candidatus Diapherotrites archaeon]